MPMPNESELGGLLRERIQLDPEAWSFAAHKRTPGLHLSEIVKDIMTVSGEGKVMKGEWTQEQFNAFILQGYLWEEIFTDQVQRQLQASYMRVPEIAVSLDMHNPHAFWIEFGVTPVPKGYVIMSPDGIRSDIAPVRGLEMKWTTKSVNMRPERDRPDWFYMAPGYLYGLSLAMQLEITWMEWHIQFPCGDYQGSGPIYERWMRQYSVPEQRDLWSLVSGHVADRISSNPQHAWSQYA